MKSLILADRTDVHAKAVAQHLQDMGVQADLFSFNQFNSDTDISFQLGDEKDTRLILKGGTVIDFATYDSIWHRRPGKFAAETFPMPWVQQFVMSETRGALSGTLQAMQCLWVNHPSRDANCAFKLLQLRTAQRFGLKIPNTLVTNNPTQALDFYEKCKRKVIYKLISEGTNGLIPTFEAPSGVPTLPLRDVDIQFLEQVRLAPHLFQEQIIKGYDIRATVIGKKIFAFRIDSQVGLGKVDWRQDYSVPMMPCELPDDVSEKCLRLMQALGLNYGAMDFCVSEEGEHYFLEVNCAGQYLWLEKRTPVPLSKELALLLAGKSEPMVGADTVFALAQ
jgi:glutathione synthase/RimK-type ligase-like ATP-grasp enzyme